MIGKSVICFDSTAEETRWYALADATVVNAEKECNGLHFPFNSDKEP